MAARGEHAPEAVIPHPPELPAPSWRRLLSFAMRYILAALSILALACITAAPAHAAQFTLTWSDNSTNETGFVIERAPGLDATSDFEPIANVGAGVTSYVDAGLPNEAAYSYRLYAWNAAGNSGYSNTASGTTPPAKPDGAPGLAPLEKEPEYTPPIPLESTVMLPAGRSLRVVASAPAP